MNSRQTSFLYLLVVFLHDRPLLAELDTGKFQQTARAVVRLEYVYVDTQKSEIRIGSQGSGVLVRTREGAFILSSYHILPSFDEEQHDLAWFRIQFPGESKFAWARLPDHNAISVKSDLVILEVQGRTLEFNIGLQLGRRIPSSKRAYAIAYPNGDHRVKGFNIESHRRFASEDLETTIIVLSGEMGPGASGGALVDATGNLLGIWYGSFTSLRQGIAISFESLNQFISKRQLPPNDYPTELTEYESWEDFSDDIEMPDEELELTDDDLLVGGKPQIARPTIPIRRGRSSQLQRPVRVIQTPSGGFRCLSHR